jgi:hypothetical protein
MKWMTQEEKMNELGLAGEKIVTNMLNSLGSNLKIEHSVDKYDREKDMLVDGYKVEVKTQVPFVMKNAFTFLPKQLNKCRGVDVLYFVSVPPPRNEDKWAGWIFRAEPKNFKTTSYTTRDGRNMILVPREQEALVPIQKMSDEEIKVLMQYTVSGF